MAAILQFMVLREKRVIAFSIASARVWIVRRYDIVMAYFCVVFLGGNFYAVNT